MTLIHLTAIAWCQNCDWYVKGDDQALVDRQADKHAKTPGHPTVSGGKPEVRRG